MDLQLEAQVVLVVGGTGLIGRAVVESLRGEGAIAVSASRSGEEGIVMDARDGDSVAAAVASLIAEHGRIDGLVVAAAPSAQTMDPARTSEPGQVLEAVDAKALTFLRVANAVLGAMTKAGYGRIVAISGQNASLTGNIAGGVRNSALVVISKNLADSVAGSGVTVNCVNPGQVREDAGTSVGHGSAGQSRPADVARLITFLVSPIAGAVSGESIAIGHKVRGVVTL